MSRLNIQLEILFLLLLVLLGFGFAKPVLAIVPIIQNVTVWNSGADVILNVTVFHDPEILSHFVNMTQINITGVLKNFTVELQPTTTFTVVCNVGPVEGTPNATVRAHCIVNGWSPWFGPVTVPEFSFPILLLTLMLTVAFLAFAFRKKRSQSNS